MQRDLPQSSVSPVSEPILQAEHPQTPGKTKPVSSVSMIELIHMRKISGGRAQLEPSVYWACSFLKKLPMV